MGCGTRQDGQGQKDPCDTSCGTGQDGQGQKDPCDTSCGTGQDGQGQKDPCDTSCGTRQDGQGQKDPCDTSCGTRQVGQKDQLCRVSKDQTVLRGTFIAREGGVLGKSEEGQQGRRDEGLGNITSPSRVRQSASVDASGRH